jgi:hypothetical protein
VSWLDRLVCPPAALAEHYGPLAVMVLLSGVMAGGLLAMPVVRFLQRRLRTGAASMGPGWVASVLIALVVYGVALLVDPLLKSAIERPAGVPEEAWRDIGFFEIQLLGEWSWPILPLAHHPATGIVLHLALWCFVVLLVRGILAWLDRDVAIHWNTPEHALPWYYRWVGSTTARRADQRFSAWIRRLIWIAWPIYTLSGYLLTVSSMRGPRLVPQCLEGAASVGEAVDALMGPAMVSAPAPGAWVLTGMMLFVLTAHLMLEGSPSAEKAKAEEAKDEEPLPGPPPDPLRRLGDALMAKIPGAFLEALEQEPASEGELASFRDGESPLVREAFQALTGSETPYAHQREVLDHLAAVWTMQSASGVGASPELREEVGPTPVRSADLSTPHALVLGPEGAGRSTLGALAALYVHLDRGATTLVVVRDRDAARAWARRLRDALVRSSARWNVQVVVAGEDAAEAFLSGRSPAVVVAGLEELESELLGSERTSAFFASLGLIVADDVDRFTGIAEMHLHMVMRRLWALVDTLHDAPYPAVLLAIVGPSASGMAAWARHVLAAPMRVFDRDGAPRLMRALLRRRDLADANGNPIPLATIAEACEAAQVPWHLRRAGDAHRHLPRAETELGQLRRHHKSDPAEAEVVLLEGTYPDVRREADRLAHAGLRTERGSVVIVMAPPADEEMVLHEEAVDAPNRARVESLPRAVPLAEPDVVRQRHLDRALGREQYVDALRARFGGELTDELLARLESRRRVRYRERFVFDPRTDDAVARRMVRATTEAALGEPIRARCVSEASDRVRLIDRGTSETLLEVDRALGPALFPPGTIFEHPRGRYLVTGVEERGALACEQVTESHRTTPEREVRLEAALTFEDRELGGMPVRVALGGARVHEAVRAIRRYAPGPKLVEQRRYPEPIATSYSTEVCAIELVKGDVPLALPALVPLAAAVRMMIPCAFRGAHELLDVAVCEVDGARGLALVLFDRTAGSSGYARAVAEGALADLLALARVALERLVGPVRHRLHRIHDTTHAPTVTHEQWDVGGALAWLDAVLDAPSEAAAQVDDEEALGRRVEHVAGEGPGDLGRLWISYTGRTDDLVWTRHRWTSAHPIGDQPAGPVFLDVAVERRTIAWAIRKAATAGASLQVMQLDEASWTAQHQAALSTASSDLVTLYEHLRRISGPHLPDTVLALVSAIPTHPHPLPPAERAPLAALARRRADRDAKVLLAWALLPIELKPTVRMTPAGPVLQITRNEKAQIVDLSGTSARALTGDAGGALTLSWGEDPPPAAAAEGGAEPT